MNGVRMAEERVLSIQSHVVSGYVGNKAAVFPMQLLGLEVDVLNTVQFSNHTGYELGWTGSKLDGSDIEELCKGMEMNGLMTQGMLLTGYMGSENVLRSVLKVIRKLTATRNGVKPFYVCDTVLGDNGHLYVPEKLISLYRDEILPFADIITPNQFEIELLTGTKIQSQQDAVKATDMIHCKGVDVIIITSVVFPSLPGYFTGTGDCFAALVLAWHHIYPDDLVSICEHALAGMQGILHNTKEAGKAELRLIQSRKEIEQPDITFRATPIN